LFCDTVGAYRNAYRSLTAFYQVPGSLPLKLRRVLHNNRLLTIGPFGSSLRAMIHALAPAGQALDRGMDMDLMINGELQRVFVCSFQFLHTSDLPQQNDSSGTLRSNANFGCRSCLINNDIRDDLDYDIVINCRYQYEMMH
ncbi:hypothetical protein K440DRAFT_476484, partial [Wilcoxina mikolae CBS 423.85]